MITLGLFGVLEAASAAQRQLDGAQQASQPAGRPAARTRRSLATWERPIKLGLQVVLFAKLLRRRSSATLAQVKQRNIIPVEAHLSSIRWTWKKKKELD